MILAALVAAAPFVGSGLSPLTHPADTGDIAPIVWSEGTALAAGRDHHVVFIVPARTDDGAAYLYTAGGNTYGSVLGDVWRARIGADGGIGAWESGAPLPAPRAGMSLALSDRAVVLTGGRKAGERENTTETLIAAVAGDGTLGPWTAAAPIPARRFHHAMAQHRGMIYVTGGLDSSVSTATVFAARLADDGTLGPWSALREMPRPRSHHTAFVHEGALYVVAGLDGNPAGANAPLTDVLRARIAEDGSLGEWTTVSTLDSAYATHGTVVHDGWLYLIGGVENNARFVDVVLRAPFRPDGSLGAWEKIVPGLPAARAHVHQIPEWRGRIYSVGGSASRKVTGTVHIGTFTLRGHTDDR